MTRFQTECAIVMALAVVGVIACLIVWWLPGAIACIAMGYLAMLLGMMADGRGEA